MSYRRFMFVGKDEEKYPSCQIYASEMYVSRVGDVAFYRTDPASGRSMPFAAFASGTWEAAYEVDADGSRSYAQAEEPN